MTRTGKKGELIECPAGFVMTGVCGSGELGSCEGLWTKIECRRLRINSDSSKVRYEQKKIYKESQIVIIKRGKAGDELECDNGYIPTGMCGSGANADCGDGIVTELYCSKISPSTSSVSWVVAGRGNLQKCVRGSAIFGICGSGAEAKCLNRYDIHRKSFASTKCGSVSYFTLDRNQAINVGGNSGEPIHCPKGYAISGVCGSDQYARCDGSFTQMECSVLKPRKKMFSTTYSGMFG